MSTLAIIAITVLGTIGYLGVGFLVATKLAINSGAAGACFLFWPVVLIFFGLFGAFCVCANKTNAFRARRKRSRAARVQ